MRLVYIAFTFCLLLCAACNNGNTNTNTAGTARADSASANPRLLEPVHSRLGDAGTQILLSAVSRYYALKNALVAAKAPGADSAATRLGMISDSLKTYLQRDTANVAALKPYIDTIITQSKLVTTIKDETCERQRLAFGTLSSAMYGLLKTVSLTNVSIYHEYCPMAFNEKGATWLSDETDIKNPYFGKKMLECGEVTDSIK
jgi:hypothetical protein